MEDLFNLVKDYGNFVKTNNLDGQNSWNDMEKLLLKINCDGLAWSINLVNLNKVKLSSLEIAYNYVHDDLGMKGEKTDSKEPKKPNWEKFHFFLQLVRIPFKNQDCILTRLCQIAYNLGQLSAVYADAVYTEEVKNFYTMNNLDRMSTYVSSSCEISEEKLVSIRRRVESKKSGAGYLHKYLKYKKKYLQKKNKL